jgi:murein L,D-transpeptidase YcbB/YkuD
MKNHCTFLLTSFIIFFSCQQKSKTSKVDNYIYLNETEIENFVSYNKLDTFLSQNLRSFYKHRNYAFAWVDDNVVNGYADNFIILLNQKKAFPKTGLYADRLNTSYHSFVNGNPHTNEIHNAIVELELLFTTNFFTYAQNNWGGIANEKIKSINWYITKKSIDYVQLLDSVLSNDPNQLISFEPLYRQYQLLKIYLKRYGDIEVNNTWVVLPNSIPELKLGNSSSVISAIKKQLYVFGDLKENDSTNLFNVGLMVAIQKFQNRNGIKSTGILNANTIAALRISIHERIEQLLINMERCKWVPVKQAGDYLVVNIPAFKLYVYQSDSLAWSCDVVVGKTLETSNTIIFNDSLEYIVFSPYWNVPISIINNDLLPTLKKKSNYLQRLNMEVVDNAGKKIKASSIQWKNYSNNFPYIIRQKPGNKNSLGLVKFIFPNKYDIYLHDTPQKYLFNENIRGFSHGCIRIEKPFELAKFLLKDNKIYTDERIRTLMNSGKQKFVKLKTKVPVFIAYFTAWVDSEGVLNFRDDIYHHDEKMRTVLFQ